MKTSHVALIAEADAPNSVAVRGALAGLALAMLLSSLATSIANVALPNLVEAFHASFQAVQWVVLAYLLSITTLIVSAGRLGDMLGRRRLLLAGIALFTVASLFCALAPTLGLLLAARALQGLGAALMMALSMALLGETVSKARTGRAMGLLGTMSALGTALGPSLGGLLIAAWGWPAIFLINLPLGALALSLVWRCVPGATPPAAGERPAFDYSGTLLLALSLAAYALAMTSGRGSFGLLNLALLLLAGGGVAAFVRVEARASAPLLNLAIFGDRRLRASLAMSLLVATVMMATLVVGPFYLTRALGLAAAQAGLVMSVGPLLAALSAAPAGRLADRFGAPRMAGLGLLGMALGAATLALLPTGLGIAGYLAAIAMLTSSYALFQTANNTAVMSEVGAAQRGAIAGLLNLSRNLGLISGAAVMGALFSLAAGSEIGRASAAAVAGGMRTTFALAAALLVVALAIGASGKRQG